MLFGTGVSGRSHCTWSLSAVPYYIENKLASLAVIVTW